MEKFFEIWPGKKDCAVFEGHLMPDRSYAYFDSPKVFCGSSSGLYKGKECNNYCTELWWPEKEFSGQNFWARGYYVSTVGKDELAVREYIRKQEHEDSRIEQLRLFD